MLSASRATGIIWGRASGVTTLVAIAGLAIAALLDSLSVVGVGGARVATAIALYGDCAMGLLASLAIAYAAWNLTPGLSRSTWTLIGAAVFAGAIADGLWAYGQASMGISNLAFNLSDPFYLAFYVLIAVAVGRWILANRNRIDLAWIATESVVGTAVLGAIAWVGFLLPALRSLGTLVPATLDDVAWVAIDLPLLVIPTVALVFVLVRLHDERLASQWAGFCVAMALVVLADVGWFWERSHGGWAPGSLVDFGFMASSVLIAVSALTAVDIQTEQSAEPNTTGS